MGKNSPSNRTGSDGVLLRSSEVPTTLSTSPNYYKLTTSSKEPICTEEVQAWSFR